jgi:hypothetical protein
MDKLDKVKDIIADYKNKSNNDLTFALDYLNEDFNNTKQIILQLTNHLDEIELHYNNISEEYKIRKNER